MWLSEQMNPGLAAYNLPLAYRLTGELDIGALRESFRQIIQRHESWRTTFAELDGMPVQQVHGECAMEIRVNDLTHLPDEMRESEARALIIADSVKPFDLTRLPLLRVSLFKIAENDHVLLVNVHHIVADGLSLGLIFDELDACYRAAVSGSAPVLPELPAQYSDFTAWQQDELSGVRNSRQSDFWRRHLQGELPKLELATDSTRPPRQSFDGSDVSFTIPAPLARSLTALGNRERCTFFATAYAAFHLLLMRHGAGAEILTGTPIARRPLPEFERLIGNFLNMVTLRCDASGNPTFTELLRLCRDTAITALSNADVPFDNVVNNLESHRDPSRNPVFQALIQVLPPVHERLGTLRVSRFDFETRFSLVDLALHLFEQQDGAFFGQFQFASGLFSRETIERLAAHFTHLLGEIARDPQRRICEMPILPDAEKRRLLIEWNQTAQDDPDSLTVHALIVRQAARTPDAIAVESETQCLTYGALDTRSDQIAQQLCALGAAPGVLIGVCVDRSAEMVAAVLGILKSGAAYVPLDPMFPSARLAMMIEDADMPLILTQHALTGALPPHRATVVLLDDAPSEPRGQIPSRASASPDDLAYVIFTSGSTGRPKGVEISHRSLTNFLRSMQQSPGMTSTDVLLAVTTLSFDIAGLEIFLPLICGARLAVLTRESATDGSALLREIERRRATVLQATPTTWRLLIETAWKGTPQLKALIGGEACPRELAASLLPKCGELWNMYGPTETTIWSTIQRLTAGDTTITIGRPIANTQIYILDAYGQPTPIGVPGELHIGGAGLSRGYLKRPELTAEKFIRDPFSPDANARLYRTGDLARYLADGRIECLGRMDQQVKLRGFRIEPGEIETALRRHPLIRQAAVTARVESGVAQSLIGYVVPHSAERPDFSELRDFLSRHLPSYMIPSDFVWLDALPLTPNGKLDAKRLPLPDATAAASSAAAVAPRNETERGIAAIWERILGRAVPSVFDDFFTVGGHSLLALRMLGAIRSELGVEIPARRLFETPTVAGLAEFLSMHRTAAANASNYLVSVQYGDPSVRPLFLVAGGWGGEIEFLVYAELSRQIDPARPIWGLKARGAGTGEPPHPSVTEMAADYLREIRRVQPRGPYFLAGECVGGICAHEIACQLEEAGENVALLVLLDTVVPNDTHLKNYLDAEAEKRAAEAQQFTLRRRIRHHLAQMAGLSLGRKIGYIFQKAMRRKPRSATTTPPIGQPVVEQHPRGQKDYPVTLLRHRLRNFRGTVTLLQDEESSRSHGSFGWESFSGARLERHVLPGTHLSYIRENAATAAAKFRELLARAHAHSSHASIAS